VKNLLLAWVFNASGGHTRSVGWPDISEKLKWLSLPETQGSITLDLEDDDDRQRSLQVQYESGKYLITLGIETIDDWVVKGYADISASTKDIVILGDAWRGDTICYDVERIHMAFEQFFNTGHVSDDVWVA
jgi:hypothetical protein